jgi:hypothetical protein
MVKVLIKLHPGYGLGDHVQMTAVMRHVAKNRPDWLIDFQGDAGKSDCMLGLVNRVFTHADAPPEAFYDRVIPIDLYDTFAAWDDRPNTRVASCLHEKFGMEWESELGGYEVNISDEAKDFAFAAMKHDAWVVFHPTGKSAGERKNLSQRQIDAIREIIKATCCERWFPDYLSAQMNCAVIARARAFVGIDSGPGKCASATETPSLICWTQHHPALYHDPAPNTTHLVPANHADMPVLRNNLSTLKFFEANYNFRTYTDDLTEQVEKWLMEVLS